MHTDLTTVSDAGLAPIVLERARSIAAEHALLSKQNAVEYDKSIAKRIGELSAVTGAFKAVEDAQSSIRELEAMREDPNSDADIRDLALADIESLTSTLPSLASSLVSALIPPHPFAHHPCLIEIHAGAGGSEAGIFAHEILTMYTGLCSRLRLAHALQSISADEAVSGTSALTSAVLECTSPGSYDLLRTEAGVHRVQRVPATERKGRTHTSAVSVMILPLLPTTDADNANNYADPNSDYYIGPNDVKSETMRAGGAGGQHVNKTESAIRLTHLPTGIQVAMQDSRSQHANREKAWQMLRARIAAVRQKEREALVVEARRKAMGGVARMGREDKVRTYNFSQNRVTDHRSSWEGSNLDDFLGGGESLEGCMESVRQWLMEGEVQAMIAEAEAKAAEDHTNT
jgi:peptide chain release factor 1